MEPLDAEDHRTDTILRGSNASVVLPIRPEAPESWFQRRVQDDGSSRWGCKVSLRRARGEGDQSAAAEVPAAPARG